jgi:aspartate kinase
MSPRHVKREVDAGNQVAVVVSAMSGKTNELVGWCKRGLVLHDAREYDAVVASGEQVTSGLMAIVLQEMGIPPAPGRAGRSRFYTDDAHGAARITRDRRRPAPRSASPQGRGRVVAGFQGIAPRATASPRSAAAAPTPARSRSPPPSRPTAATSTPTSTASTPPTRASSRRRGGLDKVSFEEMLEMASLGAKVLQVRSVEIAMVQRVRLSCAPPSTTPKIPIQAPGTLICDEDEIVESRSSPASPSRATKPRSRSGAWPTSRASPRRSSGRWPTPTSMST